MTNSNQKLIKISTQIKEVSIKNSEKFIDAFIMSYPGLHPLERLLIPWRDLPNNIPELQIAVVSYKLEGPLYTFNRNNYLDDIKDDAIKEETRLAKTFSLEYSVSYIALSIFDKVLFHELRKAGFKISGKLLHNVIVSYPMIELNKHMFTKSLFILDQFDFGKSSLNSSNKKNLQLLITYIRKSYSQNDDVKSYRPVQGLVLVGHTDKVGSEEDNRILGRERAKSVKNILNKELSTLKIPFTWTAGEEGVQRIITENAEGRNRWVEIRIISHEPAMQGLTTIKNNLLNILEKKKSKINQVIYQEVLCIVQKLKPLTIDDRYISLTLTKRDEFDSRLLSHIRIELLRLKHTGYNYEDLYLKLIFIHDDIKKANAYLNQELKSISNQYGGKMAYLNPAQKQMKLFIKLRRKLKYKLPSIYECLN